MVKKQPEKEKSDFPLFLLISKQNVELIEHFYENIRIKLKTLQGCSNEESIIWSEACTFRNEVPPS